MNSFKKARLIAGITQAELADRLGVSNITVHKWECGVCFPRAKRLADVAKALNTTVETLLEERAV